MNDQTVSEFVAKLAHCQEALEVIQEAVDDHLDVSPDDVTWANVGDAGRILTDLTAITDYLAGVDSN